MQVSARPLFVSLVVLLAQSLRLGEAAEETQPSPPLLRDGGHMRNEECLGEGCRSEGFGADELHEQSLVQLNLERHNAKSPKKTSMEDMRTTTLIESMVQRGHITANMARGLSNASLLLEAAHSAGLSSWTLTDAKDHIATTVKELRDQRLSQTGPLLARAHSSAPAKSVQDPVTMDDLQAEQTIPAIFALVSGMTNGTDPAALAKPAMQVGAVVFALATKTGLVTGALTAATPALPVIFGIGLTATLLIGFLHFFDNMQTVETDSNKELYEVIMKDMHIVLNRGLMRNYLQGITLDTKTLSEELAWAPMMMNESSPDYSRASTLTYELMMHHDCAGISQRIRTAWRIGAQSEKRDWAKAVMPLAEIVSATQASLLMSIGAHNSFLSTEIKTRLKSLFAEEDSSWAPMFREWLEDIRAANLEDSKAKLSEWTYTECDGWDWGESKTTFIGSCHLDENTDVCYSTGCLGGSEAAFDGKDNCQRWKSERLRKESWNARSLPCVPEERDIWLESVYDSKAPNQWNHGMVDEEKHYNALSGLLTMQTDGQVKFLYQVLAQRPLVAKALGERLPRDEPLLGQCQGDCDTDSECEAHLVCRQRAGYASVATQCIGDVSADAALKDVDFCIVPELTHLGWHNVDWHSVPYGSRSRGAVMQVCEGHCKTNADCEGGLICYPTPTGHKGVPGCWGTPVPKMSYCIRPSLNP